MHVHGSSPAPDYAALADAELVDWVLRGFLEAFRVLMQRSNQRLFRIARGVLGDDAEAEDVVQESWLRAYAKLGTFRGESSVSTWLTRIVLNEAYGRLRRRKPMLGIEFLDMASAGGGTVVPFPAKFGSEDPAAAATRAQIRELLEQAVAALPEPFRMVFIMRDIEECSTEETAQALDIRAETVKTRLHRARRHLRTALADSVRASLGDAFPFLGARCARVTDAVLARLADGPPSNPAPPESEA